MHAAEGNAKHSKNLEGLPKVDLLKADPLNVDIPDALKKNWDQMRKTIWQFHEKRAAIRDVSQIGLSLERDKL